jgi:hypothetical protein
MKEEKEPINDEAISARPYVILIVIILLLITLCGKAQELKFTPRPLVLPEYVLTMGAPILMFELLADSRRDKKYHFEAGYITSATAGYFLRKHTGNIFIQMVGTVLSGYLATYAKEYIWDKSLGMGTFSKLDINAGCWGSNAALFTYAWSIRDKGTVVRKITIKE